MAKIKITSDDSVLAGLRRQLKAAQDEFLRLKASGTASADALKAAGQKVTQFGSQLNQARQEVNKLANATKGLSGFQKLEIGENISSIFRGLQAAGQIIGTVISKVGTFTEQSINLGAELDVLRSNFEGSRKDLELFKQAVSGTVSEANLIKLSNQASDLGVSLKDQALLFSLAEDAADKYGGSVEENFQRVIMATDGTQKGLRAVGVSVTEFKEELDKLTKAQGVNLDSLTAEEQMQIRLQAIYNLTGTNLDSVTKKVADQKDQIEALKVKYEELKTLFGSTLLKGLSDTFQGFQKLNEITKVTEKGMGLVEAAVTSLALVLTKFNAIGFFTFLINQLSEAKQLLGDITNIGSLRQQASQSTELASETRGEPLGKFADLIPQTDTDASKRSRKTIGSFGKGRSPLIPDKTELTEQEKYIENLKRINAELAFAFSVQQTPSNNLSPFRDITGNNLSLLASTVRGVNRDENFKSFAEMRDELISAFQTASGSLQNMLNILNIGTDSFISKMITGFNDVLSIIQGIVTFLQAINTGAGLVKTVLGIVTGGAVGNLPALNGGVSSNSININLTGRLVGDGGQLVGVINHTNIRNARRSLGTA